MKRLNDFLFRIEKAVAIFFCVLMCVIVIAEIAWRYFLGTTVMVGVQEFAKWSYIWMINMACAAALYKKSHIAVDYFMNKLCPLKMQDIIEILTTIILALSFMAVVITGFPFAMNQWQLRATSADIPKTIPFLSVPVAFSFMLVHTLIHVKVVLEKVFFAKRKKDD